jgi:hypothetical protein
VSRNVYFRLAAYGLPFGLCALWYLPTLSGAFLSDDYAVVGALATWSKHGAMWSALLHQFYAGLESPSNYYRPLTFVTFGINYALAGADPGPWRLFNLGIHIANGILLFAIVRKLDASRDVSPAIVAPALAAAIFLLFPSNAEAVAWISGRYDLLATFFTMGTVVLLQRSARPFDGFYIGSLFAAACALASKESAVLVAAWVIAAALARRFSGARWVRLTLRDVVPWIVLTLAYFGLRAAIFGDPLRVYPGTSPAAALLGGEWLNVVASVPPWIAALLPRPVPRALFLIALFALAIFGAVQCWARRDTRATWCAFAATTVLSIVLVLPHLQMLSPRGEQGRLFYSTSALVALMIAFSLSIAPTPTPSPRWRARIRCGVLATVAVLLVTQLILLQVNIAAWTRAGVEANTLLDDLPSLAMSVPKTGYAFVLIPDHVGPVPFGRNAQGGMISPPTQADTLSSRLIVQTEEDLAAWPDYMRKGIVDALQRYPLQTVWSEIAAGRADGSAMPTQYLCWRADGTGIVPVPILTEVASGDWLAGWHKALATGRCSVGAHDIPDR